MNLGDHGGGPYPPKHFISLQHQLAYMRHYPPLGGLQILLARIGLPDTGLVQSLRLMCLGKPRQRRLKRTGVGERGSGQTLGNLGTVFRPWPVPPLGSAVCAPVACWIQEMPGEEGPQGTPGCVPSGPLCVECTGAASAAVPAPPHSWKQ